MRLALYAALAAIGLVATWYFNFQYFAQGGSVLPGPFLAAATANALTTAITIDVYVAALTFSVWVVLEWRRGSAPNPIPYIVLCFAVGLAFAFPLYLAVRERASSRRKASLQEPLSTRI
ncbi:MAG TPA: DUF2834 domain-containing protein [Ramlibacter sp.]|jgi:hypothetical protein